MKYEYEFDQAEEIEEHHHPRKGHRPEMDEEERPFHHRGHGPRRDAECHPFPHRPIPPEFLENERQMAGDDLGFLLHACSDRLMRRGGRRNSQRKVLEILERAEIMPQGKLMEILHIKPGSMSELVQKLETKHYVERIRSEEDQRKVYVRITEDGKDSLRQETEENPFALLSTEEQETLRVLLQKLLSYDN